ncbi:Hypothetical predicted protein [Cloeon dipterum]|uniref:Uncharacterized protein n=1 Tax=Cloeon dipterum TaxID=197152 RepID=A0A8S1C5C5_9INSE|nr:Hypothetical predicted protein [Cloeon dipterum]
MGALQPVGQELQSVGRAEFQALDKEVLTYNHNDAEIIALYALYIYTRADDLVVSMKSVKPAVGGWLDGFVFFWIDVIYSLELDRRITALTCEFQFPTSSLSQEMRIYNQCENIKECHLLMRMTLANPNEPAAFYFDVTADGVNELTLKGVHILNIQQNVDQIFVNA